jgi:hypothetical protein
MRSYNVSVLNMVLAAAALSACGQTDTIIADVSGSADTLVFSGRVDTTVVTRQDTILGSSDTVVVTRFDTILAPVDTVVITRIDTLITPPDTVVVFSVDTVVTGTDTTFVSQVDTVIAVDTVLVSSVDTVITVDTVIQVVVDTVVTVDTVFVVDTVSVTTTLVPSVSTLQLRVGQTATLSVTTQTALGFPSSTPSQVTWVSDAPTVATVNSLGMVRGEAPGTASVIALASGLAATVPVNVTDSASVSGPGPVARRDPGPNLPPGFTEVFVFDVTRTDQAVLNARVIGQLPYRFWSTNQRSPDRGLFVNQVDGQELYARFVWAAGDNERAAGNEVVLNGVFTEWYVRITWRANADWEWSGNTVKQFFFQNAPWVPTQNTAVGVQTGGAPIAVINTSPEVRGTTPANMGQWVDDEWLFSAIPGPSEVTAWRNGLLEIDVAGVGTFNAPTNLINLGPFHGGSGVKSRNGDYWDIKRLVIWAR